MLWKKIWDKPAQVETWANQNALVMPFVLSCPKDKRYNKDVWKAVENAAVQMAMTGYKHNNLHWRHVRLYIFKNEVKAVFFDLANVKKYDSNDFKQIAQETIDELYEESKCLESSLDFCNKICWSKRKKFVVKTDFDNLNIHFKTCQHQQELLKLSNIMPKDEIKT